MVIEAEQPRMCAPVMRAQSSRVLCSLIICLETQAGLAPALSRFVQPAPLLWATGSWPLGRDLHPYLLTCRGVVLLNPVPTLGRPVKLPRDRCRRRRV